MPAHCRLCNEQIHSRNAPNIFKEKYNGILNSVEAITGVKLMDHPRMSQRICACCHLDLQHLMVFRERCIETQKILKCKDQSNEAQKDRNSDPLKTHVQTVIDAPIHPKRTKEEATPELSAQKLSDDSLTGDLLPASSNLELKSESELEPNSEPYLDLNSETDPRPAVLHLDTSRRKRKRRPTALVPNLVCDKCGKCFKDASNLRLHLVRHTGVKNYECSECGEKFFSQHLLNLHDRVRHQGEKPYKCKFCGLKFLTSTARCRHERIRHIRTPSFECKYCDKGFIVQSDLKKHEYLHSGERPHRCEICNVGFPRRTNLKLHYRSKSHQKKAQAATLNNENDDMDDIVEIVEDEIYLTDSLIEEYDDE